MIILKWWRNRRCGHFRCSLHCCFPIISDCFEMQLLANIDLYLCIWNCTHVFAGFWPTSYNEIYNEIYMCNYTMECLYFSLINVITIYLNISCVKSFHAEFDICCLTLRFYCRSIRVSRLLKSLFIYLFTIYYNTCCKYCYTFLPLD